MIQKAALVAERAEMDAILARPDGIVPVFQPIVEVAIGRVVGYEALARFPALPERAVDECFARAHRCGLGPDLEARAVASALAVPGRPPGTYLSVNVSPSALASAEVAAVLPDDLRDIIVEVTEHEVVTDQMLLDADLSALRERGARIAIDDAGAGYAGLQRVMRTRSDILKLDKALVEGLHAEPAKLALVEALVGFGRRTGTLVCAEGVETADELAALAALDVTYAQGHFLGRPAPAWNRLRRDAVDACGRALAAALRPPAEEDAAGGEVARLERVSCWLANVGTLDELAGVVDLVGPLLHADRVLLSTLSPDGTWLHGVRNDRWTPLNGQHYRVADYPLTQRALTTQEAAQVLVSDPAADPAEVELLVREGFGSLLMVPVFAHGAARGLLEVYSRSDRGWTRADITRARIVCHQLGPVVDSLARAPGAAG
jgi:EAL domain-containing protein (putative c-di-GMP-specific phosphodiesterase class I)